MDTKERILEAALDLFAREGYAGVSVGKIAQAVGIKAPSLYKHYRSKQEIFDAIVEEMDRRYSAQAQALQMDGRDPGADAAMFGAVSPDQLEQMVLGLFSFFLHDPWTARFRRMLTIEQFRSPELAALYSRLYGDDPLSYQGRLFLQLGQFSGQDPETLALAFYGPIYLLLTMADRQPQREDEILHMLSAHLRQFENRFGGLER